MNLPRLFSDHGRLLLDIDTSQLDAGALARLEAVRVAYFTNVEAQHALDLELTERSNIAAQLNDAITCHDTRWPQQTFHDLWKENFAGGPRNRMQGR